MVRTEWFLIFSRFSKVSMTRIASCLHIHKQYSTPLPACTCLSSTLIYSFGGKTATAFAALAEKVLKMGGDSKNLVAT
jgi:hypothetical protein